MSIYRHKRSPFWQFEFRIQGRIFSGSTRLADERQARAFEEARKQEARATIERERVTNSGPLDLARACDRWHAEHGCRLADSENRATLDRLVAIIGARTQLVAITNDVVSRMAVERRKDRRRAGTDDKGKILYREIAPATVNRTIDALRRVMRRARDHWNVALPNEPAWGRHRLKEARRHVREISAAEESALDAAESFDYAELRRFAIITGLRRRAVLLTWSQVDFELGVVRVITKGKARVIPLTREAYAMLWRRRGHHAEYVFTYQAQRTRAATELGGARIKGQRYPITYAGFGSNKARKWKAAGVDARIHDLRHTTGMRTLRKTGNLKAAQKLLGHTDIAITAKFYTDATLEDLREAMETTSGATEPAAPAAIEKKGGE